MFVAGGKAIQTMFCANGLTLDEERRAPEAPANDRKTKRRTDLHGHYGDLVFSRRAGRGRLRDTGENR